MPLTADQIIGKTLYANKTLTKLNTSLQKIGEFKAGQLVGIVYSYIQRDGNVYWMFEEPTTKKYYLVKHTSDSFKFSSDIKQAYDVAKAKDEKEIIEAKGQVPYYIEKYGKWILISVVGIAVISSMIKYRK